MLWHVSWPVSMTIIRRIYVGTFSAFSLVRADLWLVVLTAEWPVPLSPHVSSNHRCWYFHQPRPVSPGTRLTLSSTFTRGKEQRTFSGTFPCLTQIQTKMRKDNPRLNFPTFPSCPVSCAWSDGCPRSSLTPHSQGQGQLGSCPAPRDSSQRRTGKLIPGSGLIHFFERFLLTSTRSHPHTGPILTRGPSSWSLGWWGVSCPHFHQAACTDPVSDAKGWMIKSIYWKVVRVKYSRNALYRDKSWRLEVARSATRRAEQPQLWAGQGWHVLLSSY